MNARSICRFANHSCLPWTTVSFLVVVLTGCGSPPPPTGSLSGVVTVKGKPASVPGLKITFISRTGQVASADVAADGAYTAAAVPAGEIRVGFCIVGDENDGPSEPPGGPLLPPGIDEASRRPGTPGDVPNAGQRVDVEAMRRWMAQQRAELARRTQKKKLPLPERFLDPLTSGLVTMVEAGKPASFSTDIR